MEENPNLLDAAVRNRIIGEIKNEENWSRKREHQKRFDVYRERQDRYILERLQREFDPQTVDTMRKIFSVNLATRIVDEMSSIYNLAPSRSFSSEAERELSENEQEQIEALYEDCRINTELRRANTFYNLHDQCALMVVPDKRGSFKVRAIPPIHYDVIPDVNDPERAFAYILNVWDFDLNKTVRDFNEEPTQLNRYRQNDRMNQKIADDNDRKKAENKYIVWTADLHFVMNGKGKIIDGPIDNPIGRLPFIDIALEKDFQFFVRRGTSVVDFSLDWSLLMSDLSNIIRLQGYSQAIVFSEKQPTNLTVGPNKILWMPQDPNSTVQSRFEFASPSPDLSGSLQFLEIALNTFMTSKGIDPKTISTSGDTTSFSSGFERLLSMIEKFEATRADFDLFKMVEVELYELLRDWSNAFQNVIGEGELKADLKKAALPDDIFVDVQFAEPSQIQSPQELEDSVIKLMEQGLMSRVEGIQKLRGVSEEAAIDIIRKIDVDMPQIESEMKAELPEPEVQEEAPQMEGHTHLLDGVEIPVDNVDEGVMHDHGGTVAASPNNPGHVHLTLDGGSETGSEIELGGTESNEE